MPDDYPMAEHTGRHRFVAVIDSNGRLIFSEPLDGNPILIGYQEVLRKSINN